MNLFGKKITLPSFFSAKVVAAQFTPNIEVDAAAMRVFGMNGTELKLKARQLFTQDAAAARSAITVNETKIEVAQTTCARITAYHELVRDERVADADMKIASAQETLSQAEAYLAATAPEA